MTIRTLVVGSAVLDVDTEQHTTTGTAGGAALNVAVGLTRLGVPTALIAAIGDDEAGGLIRQSLAAAGLQFHPVSVPHTTVARAQQTGSRVQYSFGSSVPSGRFPLDAAALSRIIDAEVVVLSAYRPADNANLEQLRSALEARNGVTIYDPNPRPRGIADAVHHRREIDALAGAVDVVKLSDEDTELIFGDDAVTIARSIVSDRTSVLTTHGEDGAYLHTAQGRLYAPPQATIVRDARAAGDATVATIASWAATTGLPLARTQRLAMLNMAMRAAGITCGRRGGAPSLPTRSELTHE